MTTKELTTDSEGMRVNRRQLLTRLASGLIVCSTAAWFETPGAFAQELARTPRQTEGPFYPDKMPLDTDNDLLIISDKITPAVGAITHLSGRVLDAKGNPVRNALVEIWQVDNEGSYLHTKGANHQNGDKRDTNFQGYGRFLTGSTGDYYFRTIKPVPYPGRTPHIHVSIKVKGQEPLTTQFYIQGEAQNERDGVLSSIRDPKQRASIIAPFTPLKDSKIGELAAKFDIVMGFTPSA
jgi:protocatechuate 3,4-dioxygenase, beta subunit